MKGYPAKLKTSRYDTMDQINIRLVQIHVWNSLPTTLRDLPTLSEFKAQLEDIFLQTGFLTMLVVCRLDFVTVFDVVRVTVCVQSALSQIIVRRTLYKCYPLSSL